MKLPKLSNWLQESTASGVQGAASDLVKLAILTLGGTILNYLLSHVPGLSRSFWVNESFPAYEAAVWICVAAAGSIWITYSVMQRRVSALKSLTQIDPGTGLLNLRALREQLPKAMAKSHETGEPLTMAIFDIDRFRDVNEKVGHDGANDILKSVADSLRPRGGKAFRPSEDAYPTNDRVVFRYGGDEFIVIAFNTTIAGGTDPGTGKTVSRGIGMAEAMQNAVFQTLFADLAEEREERGEAPSLTISAGLADTNPSLNPTDTPEALTRRAEIALIEAKRLTKNHPKNDVTFRGTIEH